jgi:hypothetical protein
MTTRQTRRGTNSNLKATAASWELMLVEVPHRDGSQRLAQVYQLLLDWPPPGVRLVLVTNLEPSATTTNGQIKTKE